ncbi:MAG TPA: acetylxylan esterase [Bacteroidales bacterium]|nr:acetylxylan esterase [Bacteroidales bacterium]
MKHNFYRSIIILTLLVLTGNQFKLHSQSTGNALSWSINTAYNHYLMRIVHEQYEAREQEIGSAFGSKDAMTAYIEKCRDSYRKIIGGFPEKGELNSQIAGKAQYQGFHVERIIYESLPKRYVTASLYIPDGPGPFPAAVEVCGHGLGGKIPAPRSAILFALNGIAVMVVDPIGQGERIQFVDKNSQTLTRGSTTEHTLLNAGANLLGSSVAAYEYWDNHRAVDHLETRNDIDKSRIGMYGSSGGGTQTSYMLGLDDRIKVASVCSYFTERLRVLEEYGASDGCQHVPYEGREHLEIADFVLMMAPKPILIMSGKYDFVDYWGAVRAFKELQNAYTALGSPEKVSMVSVEGGHGMPREKREALVRWFRKWMYDDDRPVTENHNITVSPEDLQCTSTGQVLTAFSDNISIPDYHLALTDQYEKQRNDFVRKGKTAVRDKVIELLGITIPAGKIIAEPTGTVKMRNYDLYKFQIIRQGQMPVPCVVIYPEGVNRNSSVIIHLNENGKNEFLSDERTIESYVNRNEIVVAADLRGYGETADPLSLNDTKYWNREYRNAMISMHTGKPAMGQRVIDIMSLVDFVNSDKLLKGRKVNIVANGSYGPAVIHAVFLDPGIEMAEITRSVKSFNEYLLNPMQRDVYTNVLYGVLRYYDLKDLVGLAGRNRIRIPD